MLSWGQKRNTDLAAQHNNRLQYLVFGQLDFNLIWLIGDLQLRIKSFLSFFEPVCQLSPGIMELERYRKRGETVCNIYTFRLWVVYIDFDSYLKTDPNNPCVLLLTCHFVHW